MGFRFQTCMALHGFGLYLTLLGVDLEGQFLG